MKIKMKKNAKIADGKAARLAPEHPPLAHPNFASGLKKNFAYARGFTITVTFTKALGCG